MLSPWRGEVRAASKGFIIALILLLLASTPQLPTVSPQPTWNLRIEVLPGEYYMGEWGVISINITNYDCPEGMRISSITLEFDDMLDEEFDELLRRVELMVEMDLVKNYSYTVLGFWGRGGKIYGDYELYLYGVCAGREIKLVGAGLWFPWSGYGRALMKWKDLDITLKAYDPVETILYGFHPPSSTIINFSFFIPPDVPPDELDKMPKVDVRLLFPGWREYTLDNLPVYGEFELQPYRTFNLTVTNYEGDIVLPGARVVITQLIYYYREREYIVPENGTISIRRLLEATYRVAVYWNSTYTNQTELVKWENYKAYELAKSGNLRTSLYTVAVKPVDLYGRPLRDALVVFDGFEEYALDGSASYPLVPTGNYSAQVYWRGVEVYDGWLWVGYHPTIYPWMTRPAREHVLELPVADLLIQAVDTGGNPVPANFTVEGPSPETSFQGIYSPSGLLNLTQLPVAEYRVRADYYSEVFEAWAEAEEVFKPGKLETLTLPIHSVSLRVVSAGGEPLEGAWLEFGPVSAEAGRGGEALFAGVPAGTYPLRVLWRGVRVHEGEVRVEGNVEETVTASVYNIHLRLVTADGEEYPALINFEAPGNYSHSSKNPEETLEAELIPEGPCNLTISSTRGRPILNMSARVSELAGMGELVLPVADMRFRVGWADGTPLEGAGIMVEDLETGERVEAQTDAEGEAVLRSMPYSEYRIRVNYPGTPIPLMLANVSFGGQPIEAEAEYAQLRVRVLDLLGAPIEGAEVSVYYGPIHLGRGKTGADGLASFERILRVDSYTVKARYRELEGKAVAYPGGEAEIRLQMISAFEKVPSLEEILPLLAIIATIAVAILMIVLIVRHIKSKFRFEEEFLGE